MVQIDYHKRPKEDFNIASYKDKDPYFKTMLLTEAEVALSDVGNVISQVENQLQNHDPKTVQDIKAQLEMLSNSIHWMFIKDFDTFS